MISVAALAVTLLALIGCAFLGGQLVPAKLARSERFVIAFGVGSALISLAFFALGVFHLFRPGILMGVAAMLTLAGCAFLALQFRGLRTPSLSLSGVVSLSPIVIIAFLTLLSACAPVTDWDGLSYHLSVPKLYLERGGFYRIDFLHHSNFPLAAQMLYAPAVAFGQPSAASVIHWFFFITCLVSLWRLGIRLCGEKSGYWASLVFASMPLVVYEAGLAYIDLATVSYMLAAVLALLVTFDDWRESRWVLIAGILAGASAGTRLFSVLFIVLAACWMVYEARWLRNVKVLGTFLVVSFAVCAPWYLKSWIMTGNPVYPFLFSVFGGKGWPAEGVEMYSAMWKQYGVGHGLLDFLRLPWDLLARGREFMEGRLISGTPGAAPAALILPALLRIKGRATIIALIVLAMTAAWFLTSQQVRFLLPALGILSIILSLPAAEENFLGRAARTAITVIAISSIYILSLIALPVLDLASGKIGREQFVSSYVESYPLMIRLNAELGRQDTVLLYGETRAFYLDIPYLWADENLSAVIPYRKFKTAEDMLVWLKSKNWRYALFNELYLSPASQSRAVRLWKEAMERGLTEELPGSGEITFRNGKKARWYCVRIK